MDRFAGTRIGVVSDTHDEIVDWDDVQPLVAKALMGVDLILHCGHLTTTRVLDRLAEIAPVVATRAADDPDGSNDARIADGPRLLEIGGTKLALLFEKGEYEPPPGVTVVVHGGTHAGEVEERDGVLYVNGGSPSLSKAKSVAVIDLSGGGPTAEVVPL